MVEFDVPFVSQKSYAYAKWHLNGCGIAALKMIFDYWHTQDARNQTVDADVLYAVGKAAGAHVPEIGWTHPGLAKLAQTHGYEAYNVDLGPKSNNPKSSKEALNELAKELQKGPVMASVYANFDPERGGGHLVVVTGLNDDAIRVNDPEPVSERDGHRVMPLQSFLRAFKHRYIVVRPKQ